MNHDALIAEVQELKDRQEIEELLYHYLDLADRCDQLGQARECFHEDGLFVYQKGSEPVLAKDFFEQAASDASLGAGFVQTMHYLTNVMIRLFDDTAVSQSYIFAQHLIAKDCPDLPPHFPNLGKEYGLLIRARYDDVLTKRNGQWRLAKRELNYEWDARIDPSQMSGPLSSYRELLPREGRVTGRVCFFDLAAETRWGGFITGDEITVNWDDVCACGRQSHFIEGDIQRYSDKRGGDDRISCAATENVHKEATDFLTHFD